MNKMLCSTVSAGLLAALVGFASPVVGQEAPAPESTTTEKTATAGDPRTITELGNEAVGHIDRMIAIMNEVEAVLDRISASATAAPQTTPSKEPGTQPAPQEAAPPERQPEKLPEQPELSPPPSTEERIQPEDGVRVPMQNEPEQPALEREAQPHHPDDMVIPEPSEEITEPVKPTQPDVLEPPVEAPLPEPTPSKSSHSSDLVEPPLPKEPATLPETEAMPPSEPDSYDNSDMEEEGGTATSSYREEPSSEATDRYGLGI